MENHSKKSFRILMYIIAVIILLLTIFPIVYSYLTTIDLYKNQDFYFEEGVVDISQYSISDTKPFDLNGEWVSYSDIYFDSETVEYEQLELVDSEMIELPIRNLEESKGTKSYQLKIKFDVGDSLETAVISIPFATDSVRVYINGIYVEGFYPMESWSGFDSSGKMYSWFEVYDSTLEYQEIIISINENSEDTDLYNREISVSTIENVLGMEKMLYIIQSMLVAMMFIMTLIGAVYILIMPTYSVLTFMSLFDTALMLHLFFNMSTLPQIIMDTVTWGSSGDLLFRKLDLLFLFLAGLLGNILASLLFDSDKKYHKLFFAPINISYAVMIFIFGIFPVSINRYGVGIVLLLALSTLTSIVINYIRSRKNARKNARENTYTTLHLLKTIWIGVVIVIDIATINSTNRPQVALAMLYTLFFLVHLVIRALEYRLPYLKIAETNESLEKMVEERTKDLLEANEVLRDLSIKDALTKAYNRLFFEEEFMRALEQYRVRPEKGKELHVCIFDLDNFKAINDTYGHQVGDEQLIDTARIVNEVIEKDVVFSRIGGEEFTLLFKNYTDAYVLEIVEDIRKRLEDIAGKSERTTGSFGVAKVNTEITNKQLLSQADACLYYAKTHGKNQVVYDFEGILKVYNNCEINSMI